MYIERDVIMRNIAEHFCVEEEEDGGYDIESYDWTSGCSQGSIDKPWITLKEFVYCVEEFLSTIDPYDYIDED